MTFSSGGPAVTTEQVDMVAMVTSFEDRAMITNALQSNHGNVETVINEYLDDDDKFRRKYGWDESAFSSGREGEDAPGSNNNVPSFSIHAPVIYGSEPNSFYGAPSRPPSRVNTRSPMSRLTDMATAEFTTDTPSNRQEEEDQLQRAIDASLSTPGVQKPHTYPPPPPPQPQQSGVTASNTESGVHFGPANRPDYDPDEWAMVRLGTQEADPDPSLRARKPGAPVLLRCRHDIAWKKHRIGALLMIYQTIPAARNALLQAGDVPGYGYGNKTDWWQGQAMPVPGQDAGAWVDDSTISWSHELHRLLAFLEATERAYGTADVLARAKYPGIREIGDHEKDFFQNFAAAVPVDKFRERSDTLMSSVEIVGFEDFDVQAVERFGFLDLQVNKDHNPLPETLYQVLDGLFYIDLNLAKEDTSAARMAWITQASDVFMIRLQGDDGLPRPIEVPETLYLDRYMKVNGEKTAELQMDTVNLLKALHANGQREEELIRWVNPQTDKVYDRRVLVKAAARRCHDMIRRIKHRASWREHEQAPPDGEGDYYLPDRTGEPTLLPEEARVVAHYEARIRELEQQGAEIKRLVEEHIMPEREAIYAVKRAISSLLTAPSADEKWNPTHKYTLRGVVSEANTVYQRLRGPVLDTESASADGAVAPTEERWWKVSFKTEDSTVGHTVVPYETVVREACAAGCSPVLVFATDRAMEQENEPLSDALKAFVRLDNRLFKQELLQSNRMGHKRSAGLGDGSQSKRLQRSVSIDSMATNHASVGDYDDDMRDAPFDNDSTFGGGSGADRAAAEQDAGIPDLIDMSPRPASPASSLPSYENVIEMEAGVSPALAQVTLQDVKNNSARESGSSPPRKAQEMQEMQEMWERPNTQFVTRPAASNGVGGGGGGGGAAGAGAAEEEPLIDLSDSSPDAGAGAAAKVNGV